MHWTPDTVCIACGLPMRRHSDVEIPVDPKLLDAALQRQANRVPSVPVAATPVPSVAAPSTPSGSASRSQPIGFEIVDSDTESSPITAFRNPLTPGDTVGTSRSVNDEQVASYTKARKKNKSQLRTNSQRVNEQPRTRAVASTSTSTSAVASSSSTQKGKGKAANPVLRAVVCFAIPMAVSRMQIILFRTLTHCFLQL